MRPKGKTESVYCAVGMPRAFALSSQERNRSANIYRLVIIAGVLRLNYALETREPIPQQRMTGLYCHSWHYPTERMRTINHPIPLHKPRIQKKKKNAIQLTHPLLNLQINRRILLLHSPSRRDTHRTRNLALRYRLLQTDRFEYPPLQTPRCDKVDGAKGRCRRHG